MMMEELLYLPEQGQVSSKAKQFSQQLLLELDRLKGQQSEKLVY
jgi:hypothetical protein